MKIQVTEPVSTKKKQRNLKTDF